MVARVRNYHMADLRHIYIFHSSAGNTVARAD